MGPQDIAELRGFDEPRIDELFADVEPLLAAARHDLGELRASQVLAAHQAVDEVSARPVRVGPGDPLVAQEDPRPPRPAAAEPQLAGMAVAHRVADQAHRPVAGGSDEGGRGNHAPNIG